MQRITTSNNIVLKDDTGKKFSGFYSGGSGESSTILTPDWFNHVQEEISRVIEAGGGEVPNHQKQDARVESVGGVYTQLLSAIKVMHDHATPIGTMQASHAQYSDDKQAKWQACQYYDEGAVWLDSKTARNCPDLLSLEGAPLTEIPTEVPEGTSDNPGDNADTQQGASDSPADDDGDTQVSTPNPLSPLARKAGWYRLVRSDLVKWSACDGTAPLPLDAFALRASLPREVYEEEQGKQGKTVLITSERYVEWGDVDQWNGMEYTDWETEREGVDIGDEAAMREIAENLGLTDDALIPIQQPEGQDKNRYRRFTAWREAIIAEMISRRESLGESRGDFTREQAEARLRKPAFSPDMTASYLEGGGDAVARHTGDNEHTMDETEMPRHSHGMTHTHAPVGTEGDEAGNPTTDENGNGIVTTTENGEHDHMVSGVQQWIFDYKNSNYGSYFPDELNNFNSRYSSYTTSPAGLHTHTVAIPKYEGDTQPTGGKVEVDGQGNEEIIITPIDKRGRRLPVLYYIRVQ